MIIDNSQLLTILQAVVFVTKPSLLGFAIADCSLSRGPNRVRTHRYVSSIMDELGPYYTLRAYRVPTVDSFWNLHRLIKPYKKCGKRKTTSDNNKKNSNNGAPNGIIPLTSRLSAANRYFAGGDPIDIALVHGISHTEVFNSAWKIVDAVNLCPELNIKYPTDFNEQKQIARSFQKRSKPGFTYCAGAIDGMLVWIEKPTDEQCEVMKCGKKSFSVAVNTSLD